MIGAIIAPAMITSRTPLTNSTKRADAKRASAGEAVLGPAPMKRSLGVESVD
jgi:hypothetical protein